MAEPYVLAHWSHRVEGLQQSTKEFYRALEEGIKRRKLPKVRIERVKIKEGGVLSGKREYLRVRRGELVNDICSAPYGTGFFVSSWVMMHPGCLTFFAEEVPLFGFFVKWFIRPITYYAVDTAQMFQSAVHEAVLETVDSLTTEHGLRALSEHERQASMRDVFSR